MVPQCENQMISKKSKKQDAVIIVCMGKRDSGMERCALLQHQAFIEAGIDSVLVCNRDGWIAKQARARNLPIAPCWNGGFCSQTFAWLPGLQWTLWRLIRRFGDRLLAIHCQMPREVFAAKRVAGKVPIIFSQHTQTNIVSSQLRRSVDGFIGVSPAVVAQFAALNKRDGIVCPMLAVPPYVDYKRFIEPALFSDFLKIPTRHESFLNPPLTLSSVEWAKFDRTRKSGPIILQIAHIPTNSTQKNHPFLLQAVHELVHKRHTPVQLVCAGGGNAEPLRLLVQELQLIDYVFFVGLTEDTPALLAAADINILASSKEAFGMVLLEGALLAKPTIAARGIGAADWLVTDRDTGFLFQSDDVQSLVDTIAFVLTNPEKAAACGQRLQERAMAHFLAAQSVATTMAFYHEVKK